MDFWKGLKTVNNSEKYLFCLSVFYFMYFKHSFFYICWQGVYKKNSYFDSISKWKRKPFCDENKKQSLHLQSYLVAAILFYFLCFFLKLTKHSLFPVSVFSTVNQLAEVLASRIILLLNPATVDTNATCGHIPWTKGIFCLSIYSYSSGHWTLIKDNVKLSWTW